MEQACSKRVFKMKLLVYIMFCHETSVHSWLFSVCILRRNRPVTMKKHLVQENFMEMSESH